MYEIRAGVRTKSRGWANECSNDLDGDPPDTLFEQMFEKTALLL